MFYFVLQSQMIANAKSWKSTWIFFISLLTWSNVKYFKGCEYFCKAPYLQTAQIQNLRFNWISETLNDEQYWQLCCDSRLSFLSISACLFSCFLVDTDINSSAWPVCPLFLFFCLDSRWWASSRWRPIWDDLSHKGRQPHPQRHGLLSGPQLPLRHVRATGRRLFKTSNYMR